MEKGERGGIDGEEAAGEARMMAREDGKAVERMLGKVEEALGSMVSLRERVVNQGLAIIVMLRVISLPIVQSPKPNAKHVGNGVT